MSATVKLSSLRAAARELADMETSDGTNHFASDAYIDGRINHWARRLYDKLLDAKSDWYVKHHSWALVNDQALYALPDDYYRLLSLVIGQNSSYYPLRRLSYTEDHARLLTLNDAGGSGIPGNIVYTLENHSHVRLWPSPTDTSNSMFCVYAPAMTKLVNDNDRVQGVNGWEEYITYRTAADLILKEEGDPSGVLMQAQELERAISEMAATTDEHDVPQVLDVTDRFNPAIGTYRGP